ncbi:MAG: cellulase N-terminal Ig-like domain-containing protein, partial [Planctomycetota bacterium]
MPHLRTRLLGLLLFATVAVSAADAEPLFDADAKPLFAYGQWEAHVMEQPTGPVRIDSTTGKGGYGYNVDHDFSARSDHLLRLRLQVHDGNEARGLRVMLRDDDGTSGRFDFTLGVAGEVTLKPKDAAAVGEPNLITSDGADGELDVARITQVQVLGDWRDAPIDVTVLGVDVVPPDEADQELRADRRQRELEAQADLATRTQMALDAITRSEDSPQVVHVSTLAPNLLQLTIRAGTIAPVKLEPYVPQDGDEIRPNPQHEAVVWTEGQGKGQLAVEAERLELHRIVDGELRHIGFVSGDRTQMLPVERVAGDVLHRLLVDRPAGYVIVADDGTEFVPSAVHRKSKPINMTHPDRRAAMEHRVILELPEPLIVGASYEIGLPGVNTRRSVVPFDHDPREVRSDAVHATQIGYAPADPYKVAFLSTWLGTGGGLAYDVQRFELIDTAGRTVHTGAVEQVKALGAPEQLLEQRDYSQTAVYALDFSDFEQPGTYRVFVPGVGTSGPFTIGGTVWTDAFSVSMRGLLHHRSGIALGPPLSDYHRPRPHHPDDGVKIYPLETPGLDGEAQAVNREALT